MSRSLHVPPEHCTDIARNIPHTGTLEDLVRAVPRREDIQGTGRGGGLEEAHQEAHAVDHRSAVIAALNEGHDGPEGLAYGQHPASELRARDQKHDGDLQDEVADVIECGEEVVPAGVSERLYVKGYPRTYSMPLRLSSSFMPELYALLMLDWSSHLMKSTLC